MTCLICKLPGYFHGIVSNPGNDQEMQMENLLSGSFAIRQEEINSVTVDSGLTYCPAYACCRCEKVLSGGFIHVGQIDEMRSGYNYYLTRV